MNEPCVTCRGNSDFYMLGGKVYCSLGCFYEDQTKTKGQAVQVQNSPSTNKVNKSKNRILAKKPKQKKRKK